MEVGRANHWIVAPAAEGVHARRNGQVEAGKGGVALGIHLDLKSFIIKEGTTPGGRAAWACLVHVMTWGRLGLVGVYGPNDSVDRIGLWSTLILTLDPTYHWILLGDLNMITSASDQRGGDGSVIRGREARLWEQLTRKFNFRDSFTPQRNSLLFSWDNKRQHRHNPANIDFSRFGARTLRRLDRIYLPTFSSAFPFTASSKILPGFAFSDHAPIVATIRGAECMHRPSGHRMNAHHLTNPVFRERIVALWAERTACAIETGIEKNWTEEQLFLSCMRGTRTMDRCWGKRRAKERKAQAVALQERLARAQLALEQAPSFDRLQTEVHEATEHLKAFDKLSESYLG